jgi:hypothetical protein
MKFLKGYKVPESGRRRNRQNENEKKLLEMKWKKGFRSFNVTLSLGRENVESLKFDRNKKL